MAEFPTDAPAVHAILSGWVRDELLVHCLENGPLLAIKMQVDDTRRADGQTLELE
jgi:hypothetical protein